MYDNSSRLYVNVFRCVEAMLWFNFFSCQMKRFKILCVTLLTLFLVSVFFDLVFNMIDAVNIGRYSSEVFLNPDHDYASYIYMDVDPNSDFDKLEFTNRNDNDKLLVFPHTISIIDVDGNGKSLPVSDKILSWALNIMNGFSLVIYVVIIVLFVKLMRILIRSEVFNVRIVSLLSSIGWLFVALGVLSSLWNVFRIYLVSSEISIVGMDFVYRNAVEWSKLLIGLVVLVNTEIVRQAVSIKNENDLTI